MMSEERRFQRSRRDVRRVGLKQARIATRAFSLQKLRLQRTNRSRTLTSEFKNLGGLGGRAFTQGPKSLIGQIGSALFKTAKGEAPFPIPGFGGTGRAGSAIDQ